MWENLTASFAYTSAMSVRICSSGLDSKLKTGRKAYVKVMIVHVARLREQHALYQSKGLPPEILGDYLLESANAIEEAVKMLRIDQRQDAVALMNDLDQECVKFLPLLRERLDARYKRRSPVLP
jgi:hypothetical protein